MDFFDFFNIAEREIEILDPTSSEKIITVGKFLRLRPGSRLVDFGCGYAEPLVLWAEKYGISGIGIDVRPHACDRARRKIEDKGLAGRIEIVCAPGADYAFEPGAFDAATCIGATFVFGGYRQTIQAMRRAVRPNGRLAIGEIYWQTDSLPAEVLKQYPDCTAEKDLFAITREEGFDVEYVVRASHDDWDTYSAGNWHGLVRWLEENPNHPERVQVVQHLRETQDEYVRFERPYLGWAMYVLAPAPDGKPGRAEGAVS